MTVTKTHDIQAATDAAGCVVRIHERLIEYLRRGRTLAEIDGFVAAALDDLDCKSCFRHYKVHGHPPFPSHSCLSVNECIVHGMHTMKADPLKPGDLISVDIGVKHQGFIGDAAWTYAIEHASDVARRLMDCGKESLRRGILAMQPGRPLRDWAETVETYVERACGFFLVRGLGGHGYGRKLHEPPFIANHLPRRLSDWPEANKLFQPGMLIAVEPMIAIGTGEILTFGRDWPIFTADGSLSVHYEADVLITESGPRNLTAGLFDLPDIVGNNG